MHEPVDVIDGIRFTRESAVPCPLCATYCEPRNIALASGLAAMVAECPPCRVAFQTPRPSEEATRAYMRLRWSASDRYVADADAQLRRARKQLAAVHDVVQPPGTLLDVGAGAGAFVSAARDAGWTAAGVEQSATAIAQARALHRIELMSEIPEAPVQVITLWDVIEHVREPQKFLSMLRNRLVPGGRLVIESGNYESWLRLLQGDKWGLYLFDHQYYFTPPSLRSILMRAGYRDVRVLRRHCTSVPRRRSLRRLQQPAVRGWKKWTEAKLRWPAHGDINVMIVTATR